LKLDMTGSPGLPARGGDDSIELRRYIEALRRNRVMMAAIVVVLTGAALVASLIAHPRYEATTRIVVDPSLGGLSTDATAIERQLATVERLSTTPQVLDAAAKELGDTSAEQLEKVVSSSVDPEANVISITASDGDAKRAAAIANLVARSFLDQQTKTEANRLEGARRSLQQQVERIRAQPDPAGENREQLQALEARLAELSVASASAGSSLQIAQAAEPPEDPVSPRPLRNSLIALFAALLIAVLAALARDQLSPRVGSQRELAGLLGLPMLGSVPHVASRFRRRGVSTAPEQEAYRSLAASVRVALPPDRQHVVLVTSALHAEGKTTVTANLAMLLSQSGHNTIVVSGDLRRPSLDQALGVQGEPGLSDLLLHARDDAVDQDLLEEHLKLRTMRDPHAGLLEILPSGTWNQTSADLLSGDAIEVVFSALRATRATYVLVDAPPILGVADAQLLAARCDQVLVVSRLNRLSLAAVADLGDVLDRLSAKPLGIAVIGGRSEASPYYVGAKSRAGDPAGAFD
jgi:capsular polysaccharide biosynthesis protein/MinD-like ATPase involved in chromosome partitioning or flagellar assembly